MTDRTNKLWIKDLKAAGEAHDAAVSDLRDFILRGIMGYLHSRSDLRNMDLRDMEQLAQDTVQEALLKVQAKLDTFRGKSKLTTWATKIAINHLISDLRRRHWQNVSLQNIIQEGTTLEDVIAAGPGHPGNPSRSAEQQLVWNDIVAVLENDLTDRQRNVLILTQLNDIPMAEAAKMMDTNVNNLYKLIYDARLKLKSVLTRRGLDPDYILGLFAR